MYGNIIRLHYRGYSDSVSKSSVVDIFHGDFIYRIIYILHDNSNRKYCSML